MSAEAQESKIKHWAEIIRQADGSGMRKSKWLKENNISKDAYYYWHKKVNEYYGNGSSPEKENSIFIEVPVAADNIRGASPEPAAVIRIGAVTIEISPAATAEFIENIGRMISHAL